MTKNLDVFVAQSVFVALCGSRTSSRTNLFGARRRQRRLEDDGARARGVSAAPGLVNPPQPPGAAAVSLAGLVEVRTAGVLLSARLAAAAASEGWGQLPQTPGELPPGLPRTALPGENVLVLVTADGNRNGGYANFFDTASLFAQNGWRVEIWAWGHTVSGQYKDLVKTHSPSMGGNGRVQLALLDDYESKPRYRAKVPIVAPAVAAAAAAAAAAVGAASAAASVSAHAFVGAGAADAGAGVGSGLGTAASVAGAAAEGDSSPSARMTSLMTLSCASYAWTRSSRTCAFHVATGYSAIPATPLRRLPSALSAENRASR
jgi:hypothetical protein